MDDDLVAGLIQQLLLNEIHMGDLSHLLLNVTVVFNINAALGDHGGHGLGVVGIGFGHGQANISPFHCGKSSCFEKCCTYIGLYPIPPGDARCLPEKPQKKRFFKREEREIGFLRKKSKNFLLLNRQIGTFEAKT